MYFFWMYTGDFALYTFFVLMGVYWLTVGLLVYTGAVRIEKEAQEAERLEEERLLEEQNKKGV